MKKKKLLKKIEKMWFQNNRFNAKGKRIGPKLLDYEDVINEIEKLYKK